MNDKERFKGTIFAFCVLMVGTYGYLIDCYTDVNNPLIPNFLNLISGIQIIPDENTMYGESYYIKYQDMKPINVDGHYTVSYDISRQKENKISGAFFYMTMCFLPLFIILLSGVQVEKIDKNKIKKFLKKK